MNPLPLTRAAAFSLTPATHPVETFTPASWDIRSAARCTGT